MSTTERPVLMDLDHLDITGYHDPEPLIPQLRDANLHRANTPHYGFIWRFRLGIGDAVPVLALGVRDEVGALIWYEGDDRFVPADGLNADYVDYWTLSGHEYPAWPRSEVPIDQVYAAAEEFIRTHRRPTCVEWVVTEGW
ncbi:MAG TPA: Imm1 family immunity protein [Pseudonocardiaceae bacterium]|jgi:hypothetical protein|nr:Imm1 family immunity protein [Pseudonocardiaceae bacterium]